MQIVLPLDSSTNLTTINSRFNTFENPALANLIPVFLTTTGFALAQADNTNNFATNILRRDTDDNRIKLIESPGIQEIDHGLTPNTNYYLSETVEGGIVEEAALTGTNRQFLFQTIGDQQINIAIAVSSSGVSAPAGSVPIITLAEATAGTATDSRTVTASVLDQFFNQKIAAIPSVTLPASLTLPEATAGTVSDNRLITPSVLNQFVAQQIANITPTPLVTLPELQAGTDTTAKLINADVLQDYVRSEIPASPSTLTLAEAQAGTDTAAKLINADVLQDYVRDEINNLTITGQYLGSSATFAGLPTVDADGKAANNGDWAYLSTDDIGTGDAANPQYPRGVYIYDGAAFSFAFSVGADLPTLSLVEALAETSTDERLITAEVLAGFVNEKTKYFEDPVLSVVDTLPSAGLNEGDRYALRGTPPTIQEFRGLAFNAIALPDGGQFTVLATNEQWQRLGNELVKTNEVDPTLPIVFRGALTNYNLSTVSPQPSSVNYGDIGSLYPFPLPFNLVGNAPMRGSFSSGVYTAASNEGIDFQVEIRWLIHNQFFPVQYIVLEEETSPGTWEIKSLFWQQVVDAHWYNNLINVDVQSGLSYRVTALLNALPHNEVEIVAGSLNTGSGSLSDLNLIAASDPVILPAIVGEAQFSNQALNLVDISYDVAIAPNSLEPATLDASLFEVGNTTAIAVNPQITTGLTPGSNRTITFPGINGFNGAVPRVFQLEVDVN